MTLGATGPKSVEAEELQGREKIGEERQFPEKNRAQGEESSTRADGLKRRRKEGGLREKRWAIGKEEGPRKKEKERSQAVE